MNLADVQPGSILTVQEVRALLKCSRMAVYRLVEQGKLKGWKIPLVGVRVQGDSLLSLLKDEEPKPVILSPVRAKTKRPKASRVYFEGIA